VVTGIIAHNRSKMSFMQDTERQPSQDLDDAAQADAPRHYITLETEPDEPYASITRLASSICATPIAAIAVVTPDRQWFKSPIGLSRQEAAPDAGFAGHTIACALGEHGSMPSVDVIFDTSGMQEFARNAWVTGEPRIQFYAGVPVVMPCGYLLGVLFVADTKPRDISPSAVMALGDLRQQLVSLFENRLRIADLDRALVKQRKEEEELRAQIEQIHTFSRELQVHAVRLEAINARLEALSKLDGMTGLKNHRAFQERLEFEFQRALRYSMPLSLLLLDVDHFKNFNDTYGHLAGDEVLKTVAQVLQDNARGVDFVARYGGEEFVVILPHADESSSVVIAERLRAAIENVVWLPRSITASLGLATLSQNMTSAAQLIALSDKALYHSKTTGRNRVTHCNNMGVDVK